MMSMDVHRSYGSLYLKKDNGGFTGAGGQKVARTGTINLLYYREGEFFVAADTREVFPTARNIYILDDNARKCQGFRNSIFVVFNGDCPIGKEIIDHLERKLSLKKNKTVSIKQVALEAYKYHPKYVGDCTMYIGGLEHGVPELHILTINHDKKANKFDKHLSQQELKEKRNLFVDGHGQEAALKAWKDYKGKKVHEYSSDRVTMLAIQSLLAAAFESKYTGGSLALIHIHMKGGGGPVATTQKMTTVEWYAALYDTFPPKWHEKQLFFFFDKNIFNQEYFNRWNQQFKAKGLTYLRVGSPLAKIARTELYLVKVETTKLRREAILKDGDENISLFPKLRTHMGVHGLREYRFEGQTFYLTAPSRELLENLVMETTIDEWDLIHDDDKKFAECLDKPL